MAVHNKAPTSVLLVTLLMVVSGIVLGTNGQEPLALGSSKCLLPMAAGEGSGTREYYYFDQSAKKCVKGTFTDSPGNLNYFRRKSVCEKTCHKYYVSGNPKCLEPMAPGTCSSSKNYYYFDQASRECKYGQFTSCPGNKNYFKYKSVCESTCAPFLEKTPDADAYKCLLPRDNGTCSDAKHFYYFDKSTTSCKISLFSSCPGNRNFFKFKSVCEKTCASFYTAGSPKCLNPMDAGACTGTNQYYYYDQASRSCISGTFTDCPGNLNYFRYKSVCESSCAPYIGESSAPKETSSTRSSKCLLPKDEGTCSGSRTYFYFDQKSKTCQSGEFTSCPGNLNYFGRQKVCESTCDPYLDKKAMKCLEPKIVGNCAGTREYYYYSNTAKSCLKTTFSSCPGSKNYFARKSVCEQTCGAFIPAPVRVYFPWE